MHPGQPERADVLGVPAYRTLADGGRRDRAVRHGRRLPTLGTVRSRTPTRRSPPGPILWLQLGVIAWDAARVAHDGGLEVVMDRCTAIEWRRIAGR